MNVPPRVDSSANAKHDADIGINKTKEIDVQGHPWLTKVSSFVYSWFGYVMQFFLGHSTSSTARAMLATHLRSLLSLSLSQQHEKMTSALESTPECSCPQTPCIHTESRFICMEEGHRGLDGIARDSQPSCCVDVDGDAIHLLFE